MTKSSGFRLPSPVDGYPTRTLCIDVPDQRDYLQAFWGHMFDLTKWWTWEHGILGDTRAKTAAEYWRSIIFGSYQNYLDNLPCGEGEAVEFDFTEDCILRYRTDPLGEWSNVPGWTSFAAACYAGEDGRTPELRLVDMGAGERQLEWKYTDEPNISENWRPAGSIYDGTDGATGAQGPQGEPGICLDCGSITDVCSIAGGITKRWYAGLLLFFNTWYNRRAIHDRVNPSTYDATIDGYPYDWADRDDVRDLIYAIEDNVLLYGADMTAALTAFLYAVDDATTQPEVRCALWCEMNGSYITTAQLAGWFERMDDMTGSYDAHLEAIADFGRLTQADEFAAMLSLSMASPTEYICDDCDCIGTWEKVFDFTDSNGGWTASHITPGYANFGTYIDGNGWQHTNAQSSAGANYSRAAVIASPTISGLTTFTSVEVTFQRTAGSYDANAFWWFIRQGETTLAIESAQPGPSGTFTKSWSGSVVAAQMRVGVRSSYKTTASYSGSVMITRVVLRGTGPNPFA